MHREGLVDAKDADDFNARFDMIEWNEGFLKWFRRYKAEEIFFDQFVKLLVLGCPPAPANDSINSVMHVKTHYKASEWVQFNDSMHKLVKQLYQLLELAITDRGAYCYRESYEHLCIDQLTWIRMTAQQRVIHLCKASSTSS